MTENVIVDFTPFLNPIVGETADSCINVNAPFEDEFLQVMDDDDRVENAYLYNSVNVTNAGGAELMATLCGDFEKVNNHNAIFEGR